MYCVSAILLNFPASLPLAPELVTVMPEVTYGTAVKESLGVPADVPVAYLTASTGDMGLGVNGTFVPLSSTRFLMVFTGQLTSRMWRRISSSLLVLFQHILLKPHFSYAEQLLPWVNMYGRTWAKRLLTPKLSLKPDVVDCWNMPGNLGLLVSANWGS